MTGYTCCYGGCYGLEYTLAEIFGIYTLVMIFWASCKLGAVLVGILQDAFD